LWWLRFTDARYFMRQMGNWKRRLPGVLVAAACSTIGSGHVNAQADYTRYQAFTLLSEACLAHQLNDNAIVRSALLAGISLRASCDCAAMAFLYPLSFERTLAIANGATLTAVEAENHTALLVSCVGLQ